MKLHRRIYRAEDDLRRVAAFLSRTWTPTGPLQPSWIGDVSWWARREWETENLIWEDEAGEIVGFYDGDDTGAFEIAVAPETVGTEAHRRMVEEVESSPRRPDLDPPSGWRTNAPQDHPGLITFFEGMGYVRQEDLLPFLLRSLEGNIERPDLPAGFAVRSLKGEEEIEARVAVHDAGFGGKTEVEGFRRVMRLCTYRPELDLVAVAPEGTFAASCLFWWDERTRVGQIEPVSTHREYRRRGLGRAVILEGFRRLKDIGAETAYVRPADEPDLIAFYESCGFRVSNRHPVCFKPDSRIDQTPRSASIP